MCTLGAICIMTMAKALLTVGKKQQDYTKTSSADFSDEE
jgi:hypothetical protein